MIKEGWDIHFRLVVLPLAATMFILVALGAKLIYGDWAIAWDFGSFSVALATLYFMWVKYLVS